MTERCESSTKLYRRWASIKARCFHKNRESYPDYGGRGITMCDDWRYSYPSFKKWFNYQPECNIKNIEIDRTNNDGDYCPENCRLVSRAVNANNMRIRSLFHTPLGSFTKVGDAAIALGVVTRTVYQRCAGGRKGGKFYPPQEGYSMETLRKKT